ncbi:hypothetical protein ISCGN_009653 [Ixodes scapularis]
MREEGSKFDAVVEGARASGGCDGGSARPCRQGCVRPAGTEPGISIPRKPSETKRWRGTAIKNDNESSRPKERGEKAITVKASPLQPGQKANILRVRKGVRVASDENSRPPGPGGPEPPPAVNRTHPRSASRDRLSDCSTRSSSGRGYMCDSESDSERVSTLCHFLPRRFTDFADNLRRTQGSVPDQLNPYTGASVARRQISLEVV